MVGPNLAQLKQQKCSCFRGCTQCWEGGSQDWPNRPIFRRPLKTTFDMTALIFSTGGCPSYPFYSFKRGPWYLFFVASDRKTLSGKSPLKTTRARTPERGTPPQLKTKVDVCKVDVKGSPTYFHVLEHQEPVVVAVWRHVPDTTFRMG